MWIIIGLALAQESLEVEKHKASHRSITTSIVIDAPPDAVWAVLTDFDAYPEWSHAFRSLEGDFRDGGTVTVVYDRNPDKRDAKLEFEHVLTVRPGEMFSWSDPFMGGMTDHHVFRVEPFGEGKTRFVQSDEARGGLTWLFGGAVMKFEAEHYPRFNQALKTEVESRR